ncbi:NAD(P)-binding domain-containing protein [Ohtaekwangia koreensis]|uniref:Glutamyl-tRNA reductase n=1 Tax=Ohtaekwangia koreensis TaxID=688867 RepID=A0A1T5KSM7_9BACT|nr:NAD(P)-binding domain-containing protein [Ohtaekwangia koreensis]SKC66643.1 glutamyl-tRNA reductase [Ohtaekwangia koreensis]
MNTITILSLSYKRAPLDIRSAFQFDDQERKQWYANMRTTRGLIGGMVLSTCNRTEFYLETNADFSPTQFISAMQQLKGSAIPEELFEVISQEEGISYSMEVANGLHSMVMGDKQIIAQLKNVYRESLEADGITTLLERLFQAVFRSYKRIHNETTLHTGSRSISFIALKKIRNVIMQPAGNVSILLAGAGEIAADFLKYATAKGYNVTITNRTNERAVALASRFNIKMLPFENFRSHVTSFDVIVSGASVQGLFTEADLNPADNQILIDLTTYKSIDLKHKENFTFFSIDDLGEERDLQDALQSKAIVPAREIIEEESDIYRKWISDRSLRLFASSVNEYTSR